MEQENMYDVDDDSGGDWAEEDISNEDHDYSAANRHYKVLKQEDIKQLLEDDISTVSGVLSVSRGVACTLLCQNNWSLTSVYENWFSVESAAAKPAEEPESGTEEVCKICCRKICSLQKMVSTAACGHPFCPECLEKYIAAAINDGDGCLTMRCPEPGCEATVGLDTVEGLTSADDREKYYKYLHRSYVEQNRNRNMKWCPSPGCDRAIEFDVFVARESDDVSCDCCSFKFCWRCGEESHRPVGCEMAAEWLEKKRLEGENTEWILAHTKPCPKCSMPVENDSNVFAWKHCSCGHITSHFLRSNYIEIERSENAKNFKERYPHYYERWDFNDRSMKMAVDDLNCVRGDDDHDINVAEAWEQIVEGRRVLRWSYAYGYYLSLEEEKNSGKMRLLESFQGTAENSLERVHNCVMLMNNTIDLVKLTWLARKCFQNLVVVVEGYILSDQVVEVEVDRDSCAGANCSSKQNNRDEEETELQVVDRIEELSII